MQDSIHMHVLHFVYLPSTSSYLIMTLAVVRFVLQIVPLEQFPKLRLIVYFWFLSLGQLIITCLKYNWLFRMQHYLRSAMNLENRYFKRRKAPTLSVSDALNTVGRDIKVEIFKVDTSVRHLGRQTVTEMTNSQMSVDLKSLRPKYLFLSKLY